MMKIKNFLRIGLMLMACGFLLMSCKKDSPSPEKTPNDQTDPNKNDSGNTGGNNPGGNTGNNPGGNTGNNPGGNNNNTGGNGTGDSGNTGTGTGEGGNTGTGTGEGGNSDTPGSDPSGNDKPVDKFYKVSYDANGGSDAPSPVDIKEGESVTLASAITRQDYLFEGWKAADNKIYNAGETYNVTADVTFVAQWKYDPTYTVTFVGNGYDGKMPSAIDFKETATIPSATFNADGMEFLGWSTDRDARVAEFTAGDSYSKKESVILFAVWKYQQYTYRFHYNLSKPAQTKDYPFSASDLGKPELKFTGEIYGLASNSGQVLVGWSEQGSDVVYKSGDKFPELKNADFYPVIANKADTQMEGWNINKY